MQLSMEGVRPATRDDAAECAELCRTALQELAGARGGPLFTRRETGLVAKALLRPGGLDRLVAMDRHLVLVGTIDDVVVGLVVGRVDNVGEAPIGLIDACFVHPEARGVGVGRAMTEAMMAWFAAASCRGVDATALPGDRRTKNFFEASGFKARLITMHHTLP